MGRGPGGLPGGGGLELGLSATTCLVLPRTRHCICGLPGGLNQAASLSVLGHHLFLDAPHSRTGHHGEPLPSPPSPAQAPSEGSHPLGPASSPQRSPHSFLSSSIEITVNDLSGLRIALYLWETCVMVPGSGPLFL